MLNGKHILLIIVGAVFAAALVSFWWSSGSGAEGGPAGQRQEQSVDNAGNMVIRDDSGERVECELPVERIVSCYSAFTVMLERLNAEKCLVGATRKQARRLGIKSIGTHLKPVLESILAVEPDLVVISSNRSEIVNRLRRHLRSAGIELLALHPESVEETLVCLRMLGKLTGTEKRADDLLRQVEKKLAAIDRSVADISSSGRRPSVFFEVRSMPSLLTCGMDSVAYDVIRRAGGKPVYSKSGTVKKVPLELVVDKEPDFYIQQKGVMNPNPVPPAEHSVLSNLECVQKGDVLQIDEKKISRPNPDIAATVQEVHRFLFKETY